MKPEAWDSLFPPSLLIRTEKPDELLNSNQSVTARSLSSSRPNSARSCSPSRSSSRHKRMEQKNQFVINPNRAQNFLKAIYIENLEYLVAACEDGVVYVLGYDFKATKQFMQSTSNPTTPITSQLTRDSLDEHKLDEYCLTDINYLLNSPKLKAIMDRLRGDQVIINGSQTQSDLHLDIASPENVTGEKTEDATTPAEDEARVNTEAQTGRHGPFNRQTLASVHCQGWQQFACASADWSVYVRNASTDGTQMTLISQLMGHRGEIGVILYRSGSSEQTSSHRDAVNGSGEWISGSDDCTIRVWPVCDIGCCRMTLSTGGPVTCLAWEPSRELLIAGVGKDVKIFDLEAGHLYQSYTGHLDVIRSITILPDWNEYITASADGQIRIWRAWTGSRTLTEDTPGQMQSGMVSLFSNNPAAAISAAVRAFLANEEKAAKETCRVIG
ncbi:unnamed protein product [Echinostoma caproni]|uniref:WD_REPEATS_REGION domain-containing protein n=1 Tax=Echinostoma caproni TaxID=27848 RepID=A0A183ALV3_9TREM|nr:unnamed protein product [Echinostoma caproni]